MNPTCHFLIGPPASGKSTFRAQFIAARPEGSNPLVVISSDDLIDEFALENGLTYSQAFHEVDMKAIDRTVRERFAQAIRAGHDIMIDRTNMTSKSRNKLLSQLTSDYKRIAVIFEVPRDVLDARLAARAESTGKSIPAFVVDRMIASYHEPVAGEFHEVIRV